MNVWLFTVIIQQYISSCRPLLDIGTYALAGMVMRQITIWPALPQDGWWCTSLSWRTAPEHKYWILLCENARHGDLFWNAVDGHVCHRPEGGWFYLAAGASQILSTIHIMIHHAAANPKPKIRSLNYKHLDCLERWEEHSIVWSVLCLLCQVRLRD